MTNKGLELKNKLLNETRQYFTDIIKKTNGVLKTSATFVDVRLYDPSENVAVLSSFFDKIKGYKLIMSQEIDPDRVFHIIKNHGKFYILEITDYFQDPGYEQRRIESEGYRFKRWVYPLNITEYSVYEDAGNWKSYKIPYIQELHGMWVFFVVEIEPPNDYKITQFPSGNQTTI